MALDGASPGWQVSNLSCLRRVAGDVVSQDAGRVGGLAWVLWLGIHINYLIGLRNRLRVMLQWAYAYFTYQRGARLITEAARSAQKRQS